MYEAWIAALQKGIGAALQRVNTDSIEMDDKSQGSNVNVASNGNLQSDPISTDKNKKLRKVRYGKNLSCYNQTDFFV